MTALCTSTHMQYTCHTHTFFRCQIFQFNFQYFRVTRDDWAGLSPALHQPIRGLQKDWSRDLSQPIRSLYEAVLTNQSEDDSGADLALDGDLHLAPESVLGLQR